MGCNYVPGTGYTEGKTHDACSLLCFHCDALFNHRKFALLNANIKGSNVFGQFHRPVLIQLFKFNFEGRSRAKTNRADVVVPATDHLTQMPLWLSVRWGKVGPPSTYDYFCLFPLLSTQQLGSTRLGTVECKDQRKGAGVDGKSGKKTVLLVVWRISTPIDETDQGKMKLSDRRTNCSHVPGSQLEGSH